MAVSLGKVHLGAFPLAVLFNSYSTTLLLLIFGLAGRVETAADIAVIQGASLALFFAFSANARNIILAAKSDRGLGAASALLLTRLALLSPLAYAVYFLSVNIGGAATTIAFVLILRRVCEWIGEVALARLEALEDVARVLRYAVAEGLAVTGCLVAVLCFGIDFSAGAMPWALVPLLCVRRAGLSLTVRNLDFRVLLPHFGSTGIVGVSIFVFRISVVLLAGKPLAGILFTAFTIGGLIPTVFGQALAPTLLRRYGRAKLPSQFMTVPLGMMALGGLFVFPPAWLLSLVSVTKLPSIFWTATGLSVIGGAVMSYATLVRARMLHEENGGDVFGPDLLANVLIATCVPFVFYAFGTTSLAGLYLLGGLLNMGFLLGAGKTFSPDQLGRQVFLFVLAGLLVIPVFFQIDGGLFKDAAFVFDTRGILTRLPLPLSIVAMFLGIAALGNYRDASRSLTVLFFSALLFVFTSLIVAEGSAYQEGAKLVLLAQYLLPMFALVLGEMFGTLDRDGEIFPLAACVILFLVLPAQLISSWSMGYTFLSPRVFVFSVYQHLLYVPMIVSALATVVSMALWNRSSRAKKAVSLLLPLAAVYVFSTHSIAALTGLLLGISGFFLFHLRSADSRVHVVSAVMAALSILALFGIAKESGWLAQQLVVSPQVIDQESWQGKLSTPSYADVSNIGMGIAERLGHWRFFFDGTAESLKNFLIGHRVPVDRSIHPSALNYWLDLVYNFGIVSLAPLLCLLIWTLHSLWVSRGMLRSDAFSSGLALAVMYLLLVENMLKVGMRQPYPGILTFLLWGLLMARLRARTGLPFAGGGRAV